jgi:hypothetical protein
MSNSVTNATPSNTVTQADVNNFVGSPGFMGAAAVPDATALAASISGLSNDYMSNPDYAGVSAAEAQQSQVAAWERAVQATGGPVTAAERNILTNALGGANAAHGMEQNVAAGANSVGQAGATANVQSGAAGTNAQNISMSQHAQELQRLVQLAAIQHQNHLTAISQSGLSAGLTNAETNGENVLTNAANGAKAGAEGTAIGAQQSAFNQGSALATAGISAIGTAAPAVASLVNGPTTSQPAVVGQSAGSSTLQPGQYVDGSGTVQQGSTSSTVAGNGGYQDPYGNVYNMSNTTNGATASNGGTNFGTSNTAVSSNAQPTDVVQ